MAVLVVAYPTLSQADYTWIQALRTQHDSHHPLIAPHFTVIFPTDRLDPMVMLDHVVTRTRTITHFSFILRCATTVKDSFSTKTHLFLVPDEGYSALVKLHDALYTHMLASELSLDVPYIPHITVGDDVDPNVLRPVATAINAQNICIGGQITALDIVVYANSSVQTTERVQLA
jgi:hypothetical protein